MKIATLGLALAAVANALDISSKAHNHTDVSSIVGADDFPGPHPSMGGLAQTRTKKHGEPMLSQTTKSSSSSTTKDNDPYGFGEFVLGLILIPFSLVLLWKNEKKIVTFAKCMARAEKDVKEVTAEATSNDNNFKLVHLKGKSHNDTEIVDNEFGVSVENSYRLKRVVEVYQWYEIAKKGNEDRWTYTYKQGWFSSLQDSSKFNEKIGHENPASWPIKSNTIEAQNVTIGEYKLNASQIARLGKGRCANFQPEQDQVDATSELMQNGGFSEFQIRGNYLVSSSVDNSEVGEHVGQMRVSFEHDKCGFTTVIAQQMQDNDEVFTFRKWNPDKLNVPYGESTAADGDATCTNPCCCYICLCVNCLFDTMFEETVDHVSDFTESATSFFDAQKKSVQSAGKLFRPLGIVANIFGWFFLFSPIIALLKWIPLVGWLLGSLVAVAAAIFALIVGLTLSTLVIAVAWVFFRPFIGIPLLLAVLTSCYFIFLYDWGVPEEITTE